MRVLLADDDIRVRDAMRSLLEAEFGVRVVASVDSGSDAAEVAGALVPDLVIIDARMSTGGVQAVSAIRAAAPDAVVLVYTNFYDVQTRTVMLDAGAHDVAAKATDDLVGVVRRLVPS